MSDAKSIIDIFKDQLKKEETLPVLTPEAAQIQELATSEDPDFKQFAYLIKRDPTLTGQILKTANSPFYRGLGDVDTIEEAVIRLGQNEVVNITMKVIYKDKFKSTHPLVRTYQEKLWNHSVRCAIGCQWTVKYLAFETLYPKAFIAGLLHDMGQLYLLTALERILQSKETDFNPPPPLIDKILFNLHTSLGYSLLTKWHLPGQYRMIARDHHGDAYDQSDLLLLVVRLVNRVCQKLENRLPDEGIAGLASSREADILGISEIGVAELEIALEDAHLKTMI